MWNRNAAYHVIDKERHEEEGPEENGQQYEQVRRVMTSLLPPFKRDDLRRHQLHTLQTICALEREEESVTRPGTSL